MKFSLNLLKKYFDTTASVEQIADVLNNAGIEIEEILDYSSKYKDFSVAYIKEAKIHPDADKLKICTVATKDGDLQIVCGASNARADIYVIYAPIGALIPASGIRLTKAKIRGVESNGMLVSAKEIELGEESEGIIELKDIDKSKVGISIVDFLNLKNALFEVSITPNRGDALGIIGIARELQAYGLGKLKPLTIKDYSKDTKNSNLRIITEKLNLSNDNLSKVFYAYKIIGLNNSLPSPKWLQEALIENGYNCISPIVDVLNYVAMIFNQPMHAYDYKKLNNPKELKVDYAKEGDTFIGLDEKEYKLNIKSLTIKIDNKIHALAGVLGGKASSCDETTTDILLEVAHFNEIAISFSKRDLQINTDAGYRFERGVDIQNINTALNYAIGLLLEVCGSDASIHSTDSLIATKNENKNTLSLTLEDIATLTGINFNFEQIKELLIKLNYIVISANNNLLITPPSYRNDCLDTGVIIADIIRLYGFNKLPDMTLTKSVDLLSKTTTATYDKTFLTKHSLAYLGLQEVINLSFISKNQHNIFFKTEEAIEVVNPISEDLNIIRSSIIPSLIYNVKANILKSNINCRLYEVSNIYYSDNSSKLIAGGILSGNKINKNWQHSLELYSVYDAKYMVDSLLEDMGLNTSNLDVKQNDLPSYYHAGKSGYYSLGAGNIIAYFGEISPIILKQLDIKELLFVFEVFLDAIPSIKGDRGVKPPIALSPFTPIIRDFAFVVNSDTKIGDIVKTIKNIDKKKISSVNVFDIYKGKGVDDGFMSVAFSITLTSFDFTLTDVEIESVSNEIKETLFKKFNVELRS
jgi:phenylalanyl-tRNA synthetase beta chain